jgi:hypothetical protein
MNTTRELVYLMPTLQLQKSEREKPNIRLQLILKLTLDQKDISHLHPQETLVEEEVTLPSAQSKLQSGPNKHRQTTSQKEIIGGFPHSKWQIENLMKEIHAQLARQWSLKMT